MRRLSDADDAAEAPSPLPRAAYLVGLVLFANGYSAQMVWPFAASMVTKFFPLLPTEEIGFKAGWLGSCFFAGSFFGSLMWGFFSDKYGRRPALLAGLFGTFVGITAFGLAPTFALALLVRLGWGLLNGNIGVAKTYLSEICDDTNQARGMALIAAQGGLGRVFGPSVGGFLADPASKYSAFRGVALLERFPFILPCSIGALICVVAFAWAYGALQETLPPGRRAPLPCARRRRAPALGASSSRRGAAMRAVPRGAEEADAVEKASGATGADHAMELEAAVETAPTPSAECEWRRLTWRERARRHRSTIVAVSCYVVAGAYQVGLQAVTPIWFVTGREQGGFGEWRSSEAGAIMSLVGPVQISACLWVYPPLARRFGYRRIFRYGLYTSVAFVIFTPWVSFLFATPTPGLRAQATPLFFAWLAHCGTLVPMLFSMTSVFALINNSAARANRGKVNGMSQALVAAARVVGPWASCTLFAWSASRPPGGWPLGRLNYQLVFYVFAALGFGTANLALLLPESAERQLVEPPQGADGGLCAADQRVHGGELSADAAPKLKPVY